MNEPRAGLVPEFVVAIELAAFPDIGLLPASDRHYLEAMDRAAEALSASPCPGRRGLAEKWKSLVHEQKRVWGRARVGIRAPESGATTPDPATTVVDEDQTMPSWEQLVRDNELRKRVLDYARFTANQARAVANMTDGLVEKLEALDPAGE